MSVGDVYTQQGKIPAAIENYEHAIELNPRNHWVKVIIRRLERQN
jgi:hypothetical protein